MLITGNISDGVGWQQLAQSFGEHHSAIAPLTLFPFEHKVYDLIGQGREAAKAYMRENPEVMETIVQSILEKVQVSVGNVLAEEEKE